MERAGLDVHDGHPGCRLRGSNQIYLIMNDDKNQPSSSPDALSSTSHMHDAPLKKKQKRNKPTLSCEECVERKTKVSRWPAPTAYCVQSTDAGLKSDHSATDQGPYVWPVSSGSRHASTRTSPT